MYFGSSIDGATSSTGERYADSENAYAYRRALRADCTCNGRDPTGLAPIDAHARYHTASRRGGRDHNRPRCLLRGRVGSDQTTDFTPVSAYSGLTADDRAQLAEMKVAPVRADITATDVPASPINPNIAPETTASVPKPATARDKRAEVN